MQREHKTSHRELHSQIVDTAPTLRALICARCETPINICSLVLCWCVCLCRVSGSLHPGVVQKAERFVAAAQLKLASSLPKEVMGRLRVVVHTHTEVEVSTGGKRVCACACESERELYMCACVCG